MDTREDRAQKQQIFQLIALLNAVPEKVASTIVSQLNLWYLFRLTQASKELHELVRNIIYSKGDGITIGDVLEGCSKYSEVINISKDYYFVPINQRNFHGNNSNSLGHAYYSYGTENLNELMEEIVDSTGTIDNNHLECTVYILLCGPKSLAESALAPHILESVYISATTLLAENQDDKEDVALYWYHTLAINNIIDCAVREDNAPDKFASQVLLFRLLQSKAIKILHDTQIKIDARTKNIEDEIESEEEREPEDDSANILANSYIHFNNVKGHCTIKSFLEKREQVLQTLNKEIDIIKYVEAEYEQSKISQKHAAQSDAQDAPSTEMTDIFVVEERLGTLVNDSGLMSVISI